MANENSEFSTGLGSGLGLIYTYLPQKVLSRIASRKSEDPCFCFGIGHGLGYTFHYLSDNMKMQVVKDTQNDSEFAA